jgi:hypothetical protein
MGRTYKRWSEQEIQAKLRRDATVGGDHNAAVLLRLREQRTRDEEDVRECAVYLGRVPPAPSDGFELFLSTQRRS